MYAGSIVRAGTTLLTGRGLGYRPRLADSLSICVFCVHLLVFALILSCFAANRASLDGEVQSRI
jgi:hypothetical protein